MRNEMKLFVWTKRRIHIAVQPIMIRVITVIKLPIWKQNYLQSAQTKAVGMQYKQLALSTRDVM